MQSDITDWVFNFRGRTSVISSVTTEEWSCFNQSCFVYLVLLTTSSLCFVLFELFALRVSHVMYGIVN